MVDTFLEARVNAKIILKYTTAFPFRIPVKDMLCVYCNERFEDPADYRDHMREEHTTFNIATSVAHVSNSNEFVKTDCTELMCRICKKTFETIDSIIEHLIEDHQKKINLSAGLGLQVFNFKEKWVCTLCSVKLPCLRSLSRHTTAHYHRFTCETCGKSYMYKENLLRHVKISHGKGKICPKCRKTFPDCEARRLHIIETQKCWPLACNYCGKRFVNKKTKDEHLVEVHNEQRRNYPCPDCDRVFEKWAAYRTHFVITHTENSFNCPFCELKFDSKRHLNDHKVIHTKEKEFVCNVCSKSFSRKKSLQQHSWIHNDHKRFACILCSKQFNQRVSWKTHMKSYHPELVDF